MVPDTSVYGTHSFRSGGAAKAANSGVGERIFQRHRQWKSVSAKDGYVKDNITSTISVSKSLGLKLRASIFQALSLSSIRLLIVLWCSAKTRKINLMVHYVLCLLRSEAEI